VVWERQSLSLGSASFTIGPPGKGGVATRKQKGSSPFGREEAITAPGRAVNVKVERIKAGTKLGKYSQR